MHRNLLRVFLDSDFDGSHRPLQGLLLVEYAHHLSSSAQARAWLSILLENEQRFCSEVLEALSARIEQLVQEVKTEDQEAVVTELRAHEQGLLRS